MKSAYETLLSNYEIGGLMTGWVIAYWPRGWLTGGVIDLGGLLTEGVKDRVVNDRGGGGVIGGWLTLYHFKKCIKHLDFNINCFWKKR